MLGDIQDVDCELKNTDLLQDDEKVENLVVENGSFKQSVLQAEEGSEKDTDENSKSNSAFQKKIDMQSFLKKRNHTPFLRTFLEVLLVL